MNENTNFETNIPQVNVNDDGTITIHHPILNQKLFQVDQYMLYMSKHMNEKEIYWALKQIDKLYNKFEKRFGQSDWYDED
jgi:hypothetical protein